MKFEWISANITEILCDTLVILVSHDHTCLNELHFEKHQQVAGQIADILRDQPAQSGFGTTTTIYTLGQLRAKQILLIGCGDEKLSLDKWRALFAIAARQAKKLQSKSLCFVLPEDKEAICSKLIEAAVEGSLLGTYSFDDYHTKEKMSGNLETCLFTGLEKVDAFNEIVTRSKIVASSVNFSRDLVNQPACAMTPSILAQQAQDLASTYGCLKSTILDRKQVEELKMNALLAVAKGSSEPPKLIVLEYNGHSSSKEKIAFVGKGITFDSGGISLKPSKGMEEMKDDMAGGAAVLGAMRAIAQLKPKLNILAVVPCTENMPSGHACRPGDVISSMNGKTIEVVNTDAEGRLILADAVTYAKEQGATHLIDLATLTGACVVALGTVASGVFTNQADWCQKLLDAAEKSGEKLWKLPLFPEYKELIKSSIADMKNSGGRDAGAITAACFIAEFAEQTPWIHIDIAGTVESNKDCGYQVKGATGTGVRTLVQLAEELAHENG